MLLFSAHLMSWVRQWVELDLFTTQFSDKVLLDTRKSIECEQNIFWEGFCWFLQMYLVAFYQKAKSTHRCDTCLLQKFYCNKEVSVSKSDSSRWYVMISLTFSLVWPCFFFRCLCKFNLVLKTTWQNLHSNLRFRCLASICRETSLLDEALYPQTVHQEQFLSFINKLWTSCTPKTNRKGFVHTKRSFNSDTYKN